MKVSVQYAEDHLSEVLPIPEEPANASQSPKRGLWGAGKGHIWMSEDWDSPATNQEIAERFNLGAVFPGDRGE